MSSDGSERRNLWVPLSKLLRVSAWLPPGLALGWLATLATLIHSVAVALGDWAATVCLVVLLLLLVRRQPSPHRDSSGAVPSQPVSAGTAVTGSPGRQAVPSATEARSGGENPPLITPPLITPDNPSSVPGIAAVPASADPGAPADSMHQAGPWRSVSPIASEFRILTAGQVAGVFGVEEAMVIEAISNGHLPGNQFGGKWLIHQGTLVGWLRGSYREPTPKDPGAEGRRPPVGFLQPRAHDHQRDGRAVRD